MGTYLQITKSDYLGSYCGLLSLSNLGNTYLPFCRGHSIAVLQDMP